ncbi:MAG TPA: alpha/beta hydrolase [Acidimicrobiales bacterium]|nr:alpha/beta hydrolase [Acidimicrobiales bacterium]
MERTEHVLDGIFAYRYRDADPDHTLLICHGMGGHGGIYDVFGEHYARTARGDVWSIDLPGFGRTAGTGRRGSFTAAGWIEATAACAARLRDATGRPVVAKGSSLGVFPASGALLSSDAVAAAVLMGYAFAGAQTLVPGSPPSPFATDAGQEILRQWGTSCVLKLDRFIDFDADYGFAGAAAEKRRDPLNTWELDLASLASLYTYEPPVPIAGNDKPILFTVGENDTLAPPALVRAVAERIPGPVECYELPGGVHQLMLFHTAAYSAVVRDFVERTVL